MANVTIESPPPTTRKTCEGRRDCNVYYRHTNVSSGVRAFFCVSHQCWVYMFPTHVTFSYEKVGLNEETYTREA
jgi:hypothetical protein